MEQEPAPTQIEESLRERENNESLLPLKKRGIVRRLYDWVLHWAWTPYGTPALCVLSFAESSFFPIPPDVLLLPLTLSRRERWRSYALICTIASVLGAFLGYYIGFVLWTELPWIQETFFKIPGVTPHGFERVKGLFADWNFWIVFTAGFTPIPFKLFTVSAGVCKVSLPMFALAAIVGRGARFFLVSWLVHRYGAAAQRFIDKRFNLLSILFVVLLLGGFLVVKWVL
jgi:membrane protein YqaA with SNARE-associated domain